MCVHIFSLPKPFLFECVLYDYFASRDPGPGAKSVQRTRSHRMKFCVQKGFGGAALNKQTAGNVSVYEHSHCLRVTKTTETALVPLRETN